MILGIYRDFGFDNVIIKYADRPEVRVGADEVWDKAEKALELALNNKGLDWELQPGEGAFYGPKIDLKMIDALAAGTTTLTMNQTSPVDTAKFVNAGEWIQPDMLPLAS